MSATLEVILAYLGSKKPFDKDGILTKTGSQAYGKLIDTVYILQAISVITGDECCRIIDELDKIIREN